jgi:hypothetical protein
VQAHSPHQLCVCTCGRTGARSNCRCGVRGWDYTKIQLACDAHGAGYEDVRNVLKKWRKEGTLQSHVAAYQKRKPTESAEKQAAADRKTIVDTVVKALKEKKTSYRKAAAECQELGPDWPECTQEASSRNHNQRWPWCSTKAPRRLGEGPRCLHRGCAPGLQDSRVLVPGSELGAKKKSPACWIFKNGYLK